MNKIALAKSRIRQIIVQSPLPEDFPHGEYTLKLVRQMKPGDKALEIAALGHDIERVYAKKKVKRQGFLIYNQFKAAHALNSANILRGILAECGLADSMLSKIYALVKSHETGGNPDANILKDADSISFFKTNLPYYFKRESIKECRKRIRWGYNRLSKKARKMVDKIVYDDAKLNRIFRNIIKSVS